jgi:ATP phosphoribosyltransferase regulatory subunit
MRAVEPPKAKPRIYLPWGMPAEPAATLRAEGWATIAALAPGDAKAEAKRLQCSHYWQDGAVAL